VPPLSLDTTSDSHEGTLGRTAGRGIGPSARPLFGQAGMEDPPERQVLAGALVSAVDLTYENANVGTCNLTFSIAG
jgi:hypothetical protein